MNVYLLRHAQALDLGEAGVQTDEERPLSDEGLRQMEIVSDAVKRLGLKFDEIITSPLRRALETAQELRRHLELPETAVITCDKLEPGGSTKKVMKYLRSREANEVVLVGHAPELPTYAAWLIGSKDCQLEIAKAGLVYIRCDAAPRKGVGTLVWMLTPELLAGLHEEGRGAKKSARG
jgi:phosphohistidine phosphatase